MRNSAAAGFRACNVVKVHGEDAFFNVVVVIVIVMMSSIHSDVVIVFVLVLDLRREQLDAIVRPLVRTNDELAQELVAQAVEVLAVELGILALLKV